MDRLKPFLLTTTSLVLFAGLLTPVSSQTITTQLPSSTLTVRNGSQVVTPTAGQPTAISPNIIPGKAPVSPNIIGSPPATAGGQPTAISPNIIPGKAPVSPNIIGSPPSSNVRVGTPAALFISKGKNSASASADILGCTDPNISGTVELREKKTAEGVKEVRVMMKVKGLPAGNHAVHIHETADCVPCGDAGGHFDPGPNGNPSPDGNHPFHSGDLINIKAKKNGNAKLITRTTRVTLSPGPLSLFDTDGSAFIIHVDPDTYCPEWCPSRLRRRSQSRLRCN